jgi:hypothetical protein
MHYAVLKWVQRRLHGARERKNMNGRVLTLILFLVLGGGGGQVKFCSTKKRTKIECRYIGERNRHGRHSNVASPQILNPWRDSNSGPGT